MTPTTCAGEGTENPLDHAVGLRGTHPSANVPQQRIVAGEGLGERLTAEARPLSDTTAMGTWTWPTIAPAGFCTATTSRSL
jgi:hypothetical protein